MYRLEREDFVKSPYVFLWSALAFQAGFINAFGFLACGRYVSHVTGFGTQIGIALAESKVWMAIELLGFPASFILGSFISGFYTSARLERNEVPLYGLITSLLPLIIATVWFSGVRGAFGVFGEPLLLPYHFILLFLLSFICGMQNGCFATLTKGQIRTTHLTGISTDIGTDLARLWFGRLSKTEFELTRRTNISRIMTFLSFAIGSVVCVVCGKQLGYSGLLIPFTTAIIVCILIRKIHVLLDQRFKKQITANQEFNLRIQAK